MTSDPLRDPVLIMVLQELERVKKERNQWQDMYMGLLSDYQLLRSYIGMNQAKAREVMNKTRKTEFETLKIT